MCYRQWSLLLRSSSKSFWTRPRLAKRWPPKLADLLAPSSAQFRETKTKTQTRVLLSSAASDPLHTQTSGTTPWDLKVVETQFTNVYHFLPYPHVDHKLMTAIRLNSRWAGLQYTLHGPVLQLAH